MKPVVIRLYTVLVALTFVGLIAWSGADWYGLQQKAMADGHATLRQAAGMVSDLTIHRGVLDAPTLSRVFNQVPGPQFRWKMVLLASPDQGTEYYRGPRPAVAVDRAVPRWEPKGFSEVKVSIPVFRAVGDPMTLEGIYEFYGRVEIFSLVKACIITLLILMALTTWMIFWAPRSQQDPPAVPQEPEEAVQEDFDESLEETIGTIHVEAEDEYWFDDELTMEDLPPLNDLPPLDDLPPLNDTPSVNGPLLFSPESGLGWGSFLSTRLDFELERASGQNQDLALILLTAKEGSVDGKTWGQKVRVAFPSADMNFEYEGGVAILLPGQNLEQALRVARAFVEDTDSTLDGVKIHAGVAARTGRLLSASTLLAEAQSALRRSLSGTVRVLGLKTDPERYRDYLASASA